VESDISKYDPALTFAGVTKFVTWIFGNVIIDYVYSAKYRIVLVLAFTSTPPMM